MANTNQFPGLARGPIDHNASSVINSIANEAIDMGSSVKLVSPITSAEILPRVEQVDTDLDLTYGIAVGGDTDGIYGNGEASSDDSTRATASAGQGVVVVTQGRCLARVIGQDSASSAEAIAIGDALAAGLTGGGEGVLVKATIADEQVIARALQSIVANDLDIIAVDVQREGEFVP